MIRQFRVRAWWRRWPRWGAYAECPWQSGWGGVHPCAYAPSHHLSHHGGIAGIYRGRAWPLFWVAKVEIQTDSYMSLRRLSQWWWLWCTPCGWGHRAKMPGYKLVSGWYGLGLRRDPGPKRALDKPDLLYRGRVWCAPWLAWVEVLP